ncbi:hypothetical protein [Burkholderia ubonensis]|uniref:hypothetical protein n=1 Tax=Burkholderia ubonensis TaxID=101571 RepID=UPI0012F918AB|nr:hypothetical protein [Burkholderia ubonensis]
MKRCIKNLSNFAQNELHGGDLSGYAATHAALVLLDNWQDALKDGSKDNLVQDVDKVIARLQTFRAEAVKALPAENGGLAGRSLADWKERLAKRRIEIYPCPQHRIGRYGYTGCDDSDYVGEEEAIKAAVEHYFG